MSGLGSVHAADGAAITPSNTSAHTSQSSPKSVLSTMPSTSSSQVCTMFDQSETACLNCGPPSRRSSCSRLAATCAV
eukprot:scaffold27953_cov75-Phaeocystis_antarctica.AAC.4